jgi:hypothetical protein
MRRVAPHFAAGRSLSPGTKGRAREGRLQTSLRQNSVNFKNYLHSLSRHEYSGWICVEYTRQEWEQCNEVDIVSETILVRNLLRAAQNEVTASQAK